jgi:hypothetical protein
MVKISKVEDTDMEITVETHAVDAEINKAEVPAAAAASMPHIFLKMTLP